MMTLSSTRTRLMALQQKVDALNTDDGIQVAIVKVDGTQLQAGITPAEQLRLQESEISFPVPDSARQKILASSPPPGCISLTFFNNKED